jgi:hypothetical protein
MNTTTAAATLRTTDELTHHYVTGDVNGYPTPSRGHFYTGFEDFDEMKEFAKEHDGTIYSMYTRDGWSFVVPDGWIDRPYKVTSDWFGDNYVMVASKEELINYCMYAHNDLLNSNYVNAKELRRLYQQGKRAIAEGHSVDWSKNNLVLKIDNNGEFRYYEEIPKYCLTFSHDTKTQMIGVWIQ